MLKDPLLEIKQTSSSPVEHRPQAVLRDGGSNRVVFLETCLAKAKQSGNGSTLTEAYQQLLPALQEAGYEERHSTLLGEYHEMLFRQYVRSDGRFSLLTAEAELARKNAELQNNMILLAGRTELLSLFKKELLKILREVQEPVAALKKIREKLKVLPCESVDWKKFDAQFKAAHPEFAKKLIERCPDLSVTELRICSLVRMNLKSEDIARVFCLSERTVENHRMHIRKKLKLTAGEDLFKFFSTF